MSITPAELSEAGRRKFEACMGIVDSGGLRRSLSTEDREQVQREALGMVEAYIARDGMRHLLASHAAATPAPAAPPSTKRQALAEGLRRAGLPTGPTDLEKSAEDQDLLISAGLNEAQSVDSAVRLALKRQGAQHSTSDTAVQAERQRLAERREPPVVSPVASSLHGSPPPTTLTETERADAYRQAFGGTA